jgi:amino acid transporter
MVDTDGGLVKALSGWHVFIAGVGLVVAASTLVSDFVGWFSIGSAFVMALLIAFVINLLLGLSVAELSTTYPKAGALYDYGAAALPGTGALATIAGIFLAFSFYGMFAFAGPGETVAGALGFQALFNGSGSIWPWIIVMTLLAVTPNLLGIKFLLRFELLLIIGMLGLRWIFGLAGFFGLGDTGGWSASNWDAGIGMFEWGLVMSGGVALAFWSFVGIEFVAPLAEETKNPTKAMPRGIIWALVAIIGTSLLMGLGVGGTQPTSAWAEVAFSEVGCGGDCAQLAVGEAMFGNTGRWLMALATFLATLASMSVVYAAMPRILYGVSRNGHFFGPLSRYFRRLHPKYRTPWIAIIVTGVLYTVAAIAFQNVVELIFSAAYAWLVIYVFYHLLVIGSRFFNPDVGRPFKLPLVFPTAGVVLTIVAIYYAFEGVHDFFGIRAFWIFAGAAVASVISYALRSASGIESRLHDEISQAL